MVVIRFCQSPVCLPVAGSQFHGSFKRVDRLIEFPSVDKRHAKRREGLSMIWINLSGLFENSLGLCPILSLEINHALDVQDVRITGRELYGFIQILLSRVELIVVQSLDSLVERFLCLRGKQRFARNSRTILRN